MAVNTEVMEYIKNKFSLHNLSNLELEFMIREIVELTNPIKARAVPADIVADIKKSYVNGTPTCLIEARYPQYGKSTIARFITEVRKERGIVQRNY